MESIGGRFEGCARLSFCHREVTSSPQHPTQTHWSGRFSPKPLLIHLPLFLERARKVAIANSKRIRSFLSLFLLHSPRLFLNEIDDLITPIEADLLPQGEIFKISLRRQIFSLFSFSFVPDNFHKLIRTIFYARRRIRLDHNSRRFSSSL